MTDATTIESTGPISTAGDAELYWRRWDRIALAKEVEEIWMYAKGDAYDSWLAIADFIFERERAAHKRCVQACGEERLSFPQDEKEDVYNRAVRDCADAIRSLVSL